MSVSEESLNGRPQKTPSLQQPLTPAAPASYPCPFSPNVEPHGVTGCHIERKRRVFDGTPRRKHISKPPLTPAVPASYPCPFSPNVEPYVVTGCHIERKRRVFERAPAENPSPSLPAEATLQKITARKSMPPHAFRGRNISKRYILIIKIM